MSEIIVERLSPNENSEESDVKSICSMLDALCNKESEEFSKLLKRETVYPEKLWDLESLYIYECVVARINGNIVGVLTFIPDEDQILCIEHLWVDSNYRQMGICGKMISKVNEIAKSDYNYTHVSISVSSYNSLADSIYSKLGFQALHKRLLAEIG